MKDVSCLETYFPAISRFGGVVVNVLATGTKGRGFKPGGGDGFLRAIKTQHTFLRIGNKARCPMT
jgi:hypothetical protein